MDIIKNKIVLDETNKFGANFYKKGNVVFLLTRNRFGYSSVSDRVLVNLHQFKINANIDKVINDLTNICKKLDYKNAFMYEITNGSMLGFACSENEMTIM